MLDTRRHPHRPLRRGDEAGASGLHLEHPGNGVRQLHPWVGMAEGQGAVGQRFGAAIQRPRQAGQLGQAAMQRGGMSVWRHLLAL